MKRPSGLMPMPSGSTPTSISATTLPSSTSTTGRDCRPRWPRRASRPSGCSAASSGSGPGGQVTHHLPARQVHHLHTVVFARADVEVPPVARGDHAARPAPHGQVRVTRSVAPSSTVSVLSFSLDTTMASAAQAAGAASRIRSAKVKGAAKRRHGLSGQSVPSVSSSETDAGSRAAATPRRASGRWPAARAGALPVPRRGKTGERP